MQTNQKGLCRYPSDESVANNKSLRPRTRQVNYREPGSRATGSKRRRSLSNKSRQASRSPASARGASTSNEFNRRDLNLTDQDLIQDLFDVCGSDFSESQVVSSPQVCRTVPSDPFWDYLFEKANCFGISESDLVLGCYFIASIIFIRAIYLLVSCYVSPL